MEGVSGAGQPHAHYAARPQANTTVTTGAHYASSYSDFITHFHLRLQQWRSETAFDSNLDAIVSHASFRDIVGLGQRAVPLIIDELSIRPSLLVYALEDIVGEQPYAPNTQGNIRAMTDYWLLWADRDVAAA